MRVDGVDSQHEEHVKILEALGSNLKSEVARGLRLLDTCVTNIAQAKWILSNVDECLSGFSKGCPVCGTLPERHVAKTVGKEIKTKSNANSPDSNQNQFKRSTEPDRVVITNKPLKSSAFQSLRKPSSSPPPRPKPPTTNAAPVHRIGPRSKTRPAEPSAAVPVPAEVIVEDPLIPPKPKIIDITTPPRKLPKIFSVVVAQTVVQVELTDIKPYLRGRTTKVDLSKLNGFVSPTKPIPSELKFKPELIKVRSQATKKAVQGPGPASKRFIESLKKSESVSKPNKPNILDSSSSDDDKPVVVKPTPRPTPAPVAAPAPAVTSKKNVSDSGSDYDYNFASATNTNNTKSLKANKSKIGSQVTLSKRPRPQSTDSDEDYDYKKKKGTKSIFKKKVSSSSSTSDDSDSDAYERKKKKKVKRKDSTTDKEKDKASSSKKEAKTGSGSRSSSIVTSRMTVALDPSHPSSSKILNSLKSKSDSKIRRDSGSTTGSYAKSDTSSKDKTRHKPETKEVPAKSKVQSADPVPEPTVKPVEPTVAPLSAKPAAYRPGPASRKKLAQPPSVPAAAEASTSKPTEPTSKPDAVSEPKTVNVAETADKSETASTNGDKTATTTVQGNSASKADPFTLLKQSIKASHSKAPEGPAKDKPVAAPVISSLMSSLDLKAKAQLLAKLTQMSSKKQGPPVSKPPANTPVQASLKALSALVKPQKQKVPPAAPPLPAPVDLDTEDDRGIELGDDVIGRCIGDIEDTGAGDVPDNTGDADADAGSIDQTDSEPRISITFQDCLSPTPTTLYSGNDDAAEPSPEPDSSSTTTVEKIQHLLLKFALEPIDDAALLHSQDKLNQLFAFGLHSNSAEFETFRGDLQDGVWYLVNGKSLGKAVCSDTVSLFEWEAVSEEDLTRILRELEGYTASCVR